MNDAISKQQTEEIIDLITKDELIAEETINKTAISSSIVLTGEQMQLIMRYKNEIMIAKQKHQQETENAIRELEQERDELRKKLSEELAKGDIDIEGITNKMVEQQMAIVNDRHTKEKAELEGFLQSKIDKNLKLELQLDEIKDAYRALEATMSTGDKTFKQKFEQLEGTIE